jgi:hypothetical protein
MRNTILGESDGQVNRQATIMKLQGNFWRGDLVLQVLMLKGSGTG